MAADHGGSSTRGDLALGRARAAKFSSHLHQAPILCLTSMGKIRHVVADVEGSSSLILPDLHRCTQTFTMSEVLISLREKDLRGPPGGACPIEASSSSQDGENFVLATSSLLDPHGITSP
jgi:hypothetical protein